MLRQEAQIGHNREISLVDCRLLVENIPRDRLVSLRDRTQQRQVETIGDILWVADRTVHLFQEEYRSEEHTSELQSLMRISYAVFCLKKKKKTNNSIEINRSSI